MRETPIFLLRVKSLTLPSCSPTLIFYKMQEFWPFGIHMGQIAYFPLRMRKTALFVLRVKNLTSPSCSPTPISHYTREFWRYVNILGRYCVFIFAWIFRTSGSYTAIFRGKIGEGVLRYWPPTNSFLLLGVYTSVSNLVKIDKEIRPREW